jgi:hypothetical protein
LAGLSLFGLWRPAQKRDVIVIWVLIGWPFLSAILALPSRPSVLGELAFVLYQPLAFSAWTAMVAYGAAAAFGRQLVSLGAQSP